MRLQRKQNYRAATRSAPTQEVRRRIAGLARRRRRSLALSGALALLASALVVRWRRRLGDAVEEVAAALATPITPPEGIRAAPSGDRLTLAVIGDFGRCHKRGRECEREKAVARLVDSWEPDYVLTTGDNNYPSGKAKTMAANLGPYRHYIEAGRFLPTLGNHDWNCRGCPKPYLEQFRPPGNGRYYCVELGDLGIWVLNSDDHEPDGVGCESAQARWLREGLANSTRPFNFVFLHHPPYSSGHHGSIKRARWPFAEWGADALFAGHEHSYERLDVDGITLFVNGSGGAGLRGFRKPLPGSRVRYGMEHGAQRIVLEGGRATIEFWNVLGERVDAVSLVCRAAEPVAV